MPLNYNFSHDDSIPSDEQQATFYYQNDTDDDDVDDVDRMELRRLRLQLHQSSSSLTYSTATDDFHYKDIVKIDEYVDIQSSQTQKVQTCMIYI
jgi:hypothetical protein